MSARDRIDRIAEQPIRDRHRTFAVVASALIAITAVLHFGAERPEPPATATRDASTVAVAGPRPGHATPIDPVDAERIARRFLREYLADLYGHRSTPDYALTTDELRRRLTAQRPRISPATRRRTPRIRRLVVQHDADAAAVRVVTVVATIADGGPSTYPIGVLIIRTTDGRLRVSDLLEAH